MNDIWFMRIQTHNFCLEKMKNIMYRKGETSCALVKNDPVDNGVKLLELAEFPLHEANLKLFFFSR